MPRRTFPAGTPDVVELLTAAGARRPGHTVVQGGGHSDGWIDKGAVVRDPLRLDMLADVQARHLRRVWPDATLLVGLPACGAVLAAFVARHLELPVAFVQGEASLQWHRMHVPAAPQRVVLVDDLIVTGGGVEGAAAFLRAQGHAVLGVSAWMARASTRGVALHTLADPPYRTTPPDRCPDCMAGRPVVWPGVRE